MKEPKITQAELYQELDRLRPKRTPQLSDEIYRYVEYARSGSPPVEWWVITEQLKKRFDITIHINTLRCRMKSWQSRKASS